MVEQPNSGDYRRFLELHMPCQRQVMGYLIGKLRNFHSAEDLWQEITLVAWNKYASFDQTRPYIAWLFGIASNMVKHYFRDKPDELTLPDEIIENVAEIIEKENDRLVTQRDALKRCVENLPSHQRDILRMRYEEDVALKDLAAALGKTLGAVNMLLNRIRSILQECSKARLARQVES
ncbi:MAG: hypothetical protein C0404_06880 [Verrucomicrobia bacterium]|nr:hypothetical protein [Verrucomicrobiota bacterium]